MSPHYLSRPLTTFSLRTQVKVAKWPRREAKTTRLSRAISRRTEEDVRPNVSKDLMRIFRV